MTGAAGLLVLSLAVVDGDTVKNLDNGERLRLEAIDAPEYGHRADCQSEGILAALARARLAELLPGAKVAWDGRRDFYDRPLVTLYGADGRDLGAVLVEEGLAVPWAGRRHEWCD